MLEHASFFFSTLRSPNKICLRTPLNEVTAGINLFIKFLRR